MYCTVLYIVYLQIRWAHWLENAPTYSIAADAKFSDIIVPTIDTIRYAAVVEMLLTARKTVNSKLFILASIYAFNLITINLTTISSVGALCGPDGHFEDHNHHGQVDARNAQRICA